MSKEKIRLIVEAVANEKDISREVIFEALEAAMVTATKKRYGTEKDFRVSIDPVSGEYETCRRWEVVDVEALSDEEIPFEPSKHMTVRTAEKKKEGAQVGDFIEAPVESIEFGRIAAQTAKQVIMQRLRTAKREKIVEDYKHRVGELVSGAVKKVTRDQIIVDLGDNAEACLKRTEMLPREILRIGDRVRTYLRAASTEAGGPQLILSRTCPEMLIELFKVEVPEIGDGLIEIKGAAREPGTRAKIAVLAKDTRIDPVGACVGMRGSRVQAVSNELGGERVDIVPWNENPAQFVISALSPAEVKSIVVDDEAHSMDVIISDDQLSVAIGRSGQNVKLASNLTGWEINVMSESAATEKDALETDRMMAIFQEGLEVDEEFAAALIDAGFSSVDEVAYVALEELMEVGMDEETAEGLQQNAKNFILTMALTDDDNQVGAKIPHADLLDIDGIDKALAYQLAEQGINNREALAEQSVDDLVVVDGIDEEKAAKLIMAARAPWFEA
jgi:N utilization substance protein A